MSGRPPAGGGQIWGSIGRSVKLPEKVISFGIPSILDFMYFCQPVQANDQAFEAPNWTGKRKMNYPTNLRVRRAWKGSRNYGINGPAQILVTGVRFSPIKPVITITRSVIPFLLAPARVSPVPSVDNSFIHA
jgi:hypothetical protein